MRIKENLTYQDILMDFFKMRELVRGYTTGNYVARNDELFDVFSYIWLDKPLILRGMHSQVKDGLDAYYIDAPAVDGETMVAQPNQIIFAVFHRCAERIVVPAIERCMARYGLTSVSSARLDNKVYATTINSKFYCTCNSYISWKHCCEMGQIWTSFDKVLMASILPPTEYINYRLHHDRTDLSDTFGNIDTDVIALEDLRPDLDRNKLLQEFIAEVRTVVEAIPTEISSGTGL